MAANIEEIYREDLKAEAIGLEVIVDIKIPASLSSEWGFLF